MRKKLLFLVCLFIGNLAYAQSSIVPTVIDNLSDYSGTDPYVLNKADGKVYVLNNLGEYERYGIYENVTDLKVANPVQQKDIEYIETRLGTSTGFINTGYIHKSTHKIPHRTGKLFSARVMVTGSVTLSWCSVVPTKMGHGTKDVSAAHLREVDVMSNPVPKKYL